jgi:hypothetical protein
LSAGTAFTDVTDNLAQAAIRDAIRAARAADPDGPSIYLTVSPTPPRHGD